MRIWFFVLFSFLILLPQNSFAQKVNIDQVIKENDAGEIVGCGIEIVATDGEVKGIQLQAILYSLGNLNWDLVMNIVAGSRNDKKEFVQENVINASILNKKFNEVMIVQDGKQISQQAFENYPRVSIIPQMLNLGFEISYQTETKPDGYIKIPAFEDKLKEYNESCYNEMRGMIREHYRDFHGDTKCLDDPTSC